MERAVVECVPNVSEGRRKHVIEAMDLAIRSVVGVQLLHQDIGHGTNRTVFTFAGEATAVVEAAFQLFAVAKREIDMRQHQGAHPRMGAVDVCPFVPISGCDLAFCAQLAQDLAARLARELAIPVYLYEAAATAAHRKNLAQVRQGEYEGLAAKLQDPRWQPDFGPLSFQPHFGAAIVGARPFLIAWNIDLATQDIGLAKSIAKQLRASGYYELQAGERTRKPGLFPGLKAIGWYIEEYGHCQVSTNIVDVEQVNLLAVYEACKQLALAEGTRVLGSELIGLIPTRYLLAVADPTLAQEEAFQQAIERLGLAKRAPFLAKERVLELLLESNT